MVPKRRLPAPTSRIVSHSTKRSSRRCSPTPPPRIIDLDGRLGPEIEALQGYEGFAW